MKTCCNINFMSQYAFVNGEQIHINNYTNLVKENISCQNGHPLIPVINVSRRIPHFRHKNSSDVGGNPMTIWHSEWQALFPITEKVYKLKPNQIKERRADVVLNETKILEIQHSKCEKNEIENRKHDYQLHNVEIIWLVDGNTGIEVKNLNHSNRVYLEFIDEHWKYTNFKCYDCIYIDINSSIYKINPNKVKSHMIDVEEPKTREEFIKSLNDGYDIWSNEEPEQCNLYIKQQGAGNGKTFGIIKMLEDENKSHYRTFIYITKQHSAKHIIKATFEEIKNDKDSRFNYLKNIEIMEINKKYIIKYFNEKSKLDCKIIISTIDSFTYSIGNKNHNYFDVFEGLIYSIIDGHDESKDCGSINFTSFKPRLNKETLLVIDEFQDPPEYYGKAIVQIMRNNYVDVFIVGDKMQSISNEKNAFTYFLENEFPSINIIKLEPINLCRRFTHPELIHFVNFMIPFKKYGLPEIKPYECYNYESSKNDNPIIFIKGEKQIYSISKNKKNEENEENKQMEENEGNIINEVEKIMNYYEDEVNTNTRFPEDFLIVTPFTSSNPLVDALLLRINIFWKNKFTEDINHMILWKNKLIQMKNNNISMSEKDINNLEQMINLTTDNYNKYAVFHKGEQGSSIDLSESDYATRIVSCHASKGDGRKVVFTIGFNESSIKKFSQKSNNLVYDSLLHVAITRMKEKLYIYYIDNGDDIAEKIRKYIFQNHPNKKNIEPIIKIRNKIKYKDLFCENKSINFELFYNTIIKKSDLTILDINTDEKKIIDMGNHMIRYSSLYVNITLEIINKEIMIKKSDVKKQLKAIFHEVCESDVTEATTMKEYYTLLKKDKKIKDSIIPIIKISNCGKDYIDYFEIIRENIKNIQIKLKAFLCNNNKILLCPLECIILHYMFQIVNQKEYSNITIQDLYNIIDIYRDSFNEKMIDSHNQCLCNKYFHLKKTHIKTQKINSMNFYLLNHFEKINKVKNLVNNVYSKYPKINWLVNNIIFYKGNDSFEIYNKYDFVGYNDTHVIICYIKPQFNQLNYNDVLIDSIYDTYFLNNIKKFDKDKKENNLYKKFNGKKIVTCVFSLDTDEPYYIEWTNKNDCKNGLNNDNIKDNEDLILNILYEGIVEKYKSENGIIYKFYSYWREFCKENEKKPIHFIRFVKEEIVKFEILRYIEDFFTRIEMQIEMTNGKNNKENILKDLDDKDFFLETLKKELEKSVKNYLNIMFDDDEDNED